MRPFWLAIPRWALAWRSSKPGVTHPPAWDARRATHIILTSPLIPRMDSLLGWSSASSAQEGYTAQLTREEAEAEAARLVRQDGQMRYVMRLEPVSVVRAGAPAVETVDP